MKPGARKFVLNNVATQSALTCLSFLHFVHWTSLSGLSSSARSYPPHEYGFWWLKVFLKRRGSGFLGIGTFATHFEEGLSQVSTLVSQIDQLASHLCLNTFILSHYLQGFIRHIFAQYLSSTRASSLLQFFLHFTTPKLFKLSLTHFPQCFRPSRQQQLNCLSCRWLILLGV